MVMANNRYRLGFIGIGLMGKPMVLRLLNEGFTVNVWNRTPGKLQEVVASGALAQSSIQALVGQSDVILLCLADTTVVKSVVLNHVIASGSSGKLLIDLSSIDPEVTRNLAQRLFEHCQMGWVDAPVSGGVKGAELGNLAIMAGGELEAIDIAREVLKPLYQQFTHMGGVGSGQVTKICNQMIVSCNVLVIAEMMALAKQAGVDTEKISEALKGGFADSKPLQIVAPEMATGTFEPVKWRVKTLLKDLNMAVDLSAREDASIPISALAAQLMQLHGNQGFMEKDPSTLIHLYKKQS